MKKANTHNQLGIEHKHMEIQKYLRQCQKRVNAALLKKLPPAHQKPSHLHKAMRYAVLNGGKRLRSAFIYATGEALNARPVILNELCVVIEMIHAFTLIHDDLPALDNDDIRRGKPTCHKAFGEPTAILAGDALQALAFEILSNLNKKIILPETELKMIHVLAHAIGSFGTAGGEELDISMVNKLVSIKQLENMYQLKTGALFTASILLAAFASNCQDKKILHHLTKFSQCIGLAFQIHDDIVGIESDTETLGKKQGADIDLKKPVYPVTAGMKKAKTKEQLLYQKALAHLARTGINTEKLKDLTTYVIDRNH